MAGDAKLREALRDRLAGIDVSLGHTDEHLIRAVEVLVERYRRALDLPRRASPGAPTGEPTYRETLERDVVESAIGINDDWTRNRWFPGTRPWALFLRMKVDRLLAHIREEGPDDPPVPSLPPFLSSPGGAPSPSGETTGGEYRDDGQGVGLPTEGKR